MPQEAFVGYTWHINADAWGYTFPDAKLTLELRYPLEDALKGASGPLTPSFVRPAVLAAAAAATTTTSSAADDALKKELAEAQSALLEARKQLADARSAEAKATTTSQAELAALRDLADRRATFESLYLKEKRDRDLALVAVTAERDAERAEWDSRLRALEADRATAVAHAVEAARAEGDRAGRAMAQELDAYKSAEKEAVDRARAAADLQTRAVQEELRTVKDALTRLQAQWQSAQAAAEEEAQRRDAAAKELQQAREEAARQAKAADTLRLELETARAVTAAAPATSASAVSPRKADADALKDTLAQLQVALEEERVKSRTALETTSTVQGDRARLEERLKQADTARADMEAQLQHKDKELDGLRRIRWELDDEVLKLVTTYKTPYIALQKKHTEAEQRLRDLDARRLELEAKVREGESAALQMRAAADDTAKRVDVSNKELTRVREVLVHKDFEMAELAAKHAEELQTMRARDAELTATIRQKDAELAQRDVELQLLQTKVTELNGNLARSEETRRSLEGELAREKANVETLKTLAAATPAPAKPRARSSLWGGKKSADNLREAAVPEVPVEPVSAREAVGGDLDALLGLSGNALDEPTSSSAAELFVSSSPAPQGPIGAWLDRSFSFRNKQPSSDAFFGSQTFSSAC